MGRGGGGRSKNNGFDWGQGLRKPCSLREARWKYSSLTPTTASIVWRVGRASFNKTQKPSIPTEACQFFPHCRPTILPSPTTCTDMTRPYRQEDKRNCLNHQGREPSNRPMKKSLHDPTSHMRSSQNRANSREVRFPEDKKKTIKFVGRQNRRNKTKSLTTIDGRNDFKGDASDESAACK